ncbi:hypothetical protein [Alcanivorax jadensis]|uniref:hypothetical protein n=1 Tax=Alcanivorax jadensis TaxID=64988 RepID=UPI0026EB9858|nr:hypothetical protein [Alcanivorax jadensis]MCK5887253.1 hypothetical protein [Alcanivorax sp.]
MIHRQHRQRALIGLILLGLLFQVQTVFACQMVDTHRGLASDCCCESMAMTSDEAPMPDRNGGCCDLENTLSLKDSDNDSPSIVQARLVPDLPEASLAFVLVSLDLLPDVTAAPSALVAIGDNPVDSGSHTWLETRRLRI